MYKYKITIEFNSSEIMPLVDFSSHDCTYMARWAAAHECWGKKNQ